MLDTPDSPRARFVEDELMRAPMVADQVLIATWSALQQALPAMPPQARAVAAELLSAQRLLHTRFIDAFAAAVRRLVRNREASAGATTPGAAAPGLSPQVGTPRLALLDDTEVAADVEVSRALEAVRSIAEHELRELTAYTSALAGDMDVTRDHNPLHPEVFARALWDAAQGLPVDRPLQLTLMRHAGTPLAQVLRKVYAGACARLEGAGLTPAAYRTLVPQPDARGWRPDDSWAGRRMADLRRSQPDTSAPSVPQAVSPAASASGRDPDPATVELLSRLFEGMLADRRISRDIRGVLAQIHAVAQRAAQDDPAMLERDDHPLWRFVDELVFQASLLAKASAARDEQLGLSESLVASLARSGTGLDAAVERATARLAAEARRRFQARVEAMAEDVDILQALEEDEATSQSGMPTGFGPLDATQLDTVPADLMDNLASADAARTSVGAWIDALRPGDWVHLFTQGQWLQAQLIWQGRRGDVWLFGQGQTMRTTALRRRAIERLAGEGLLRPLVRRSVLRSAAARLLRDARPDAD